MCDNGKNKLVLTEGEESVNEEWDGKNSGRQPHLMIREG